MVAAASPGPDTSRQSTNVEDGLQVGWPEVLEVHRVIVQPDHDPNRRAREAPMRLQGTCDRCGFDFYSTATSCQVQCPNCGHQASCED